MLGLISSLTDLTRKVQAILSQKHTHILNLSSLASGVFFFFEKFWQAQCNGVAMPLTSNYLRSFHLLRIVDMPVNAAPF
jgi:hypothetical protein